MRIASLVGLRACSAVPCSRHFGLGPEMGGGGGGVELSRGSKMKGGSGNAERGAHQ